MAYYPDVNRVEVILEHFRACDSEGRRVWLNEICAELPMSSKCAWKAIHSLMDEGMVACVPTDEGQEEAGKRRHKRHLLILEEWYLLTDEQRERMVRAMERMAAAQETIAEQMGGPSRQAQREIPGYSPGKRQMETKEGD